MVNMGCRSIEPLVMGTIFGTIFVVCITSGQDGKGLRAGVVVPCFRNLGKLCHVQPDIFLQELSRKAPVSSPQAARCTSKSYTPSTIWMDRMSVCAPVDSLLTVDGGRGVQSFWPSGCRDFGSNLVFLWQAMERLETFVF